jgi:hypothetical protein
MPLYEDPAKRKRAPEKDYGKCEQHPEANSVTTCSRCNKPVCQSCRTRWQEETVCPQCIDNSFADDEPSPQEAQLQSKQSWISVILAACAWLLLLLTFGPMATFHQTTSAPGPGTTLVFLAYFCFLGSLAPAVFGIGHAFSAMRLRGDNARLALGGLIGNAAHIGITLGFITLSLWHN